MQINTPTSSTNYQSLSPSKKPILVFLHGWGCDWQIWARQIRPLSQHFHLLLPDLPAFGRSRITNQQIWSSQQYITWLRHFLQQTVNKQKFYLIGHSFGGKIAALYCAQQKSPQPEKLILVDAAGLPQSNKKQKILKTLTKMMPTSLKQHLGQNLKKRLLDLFGGSTDYLNSDQLQRRIFRQIVNEDIGEKLPKITVQTILIWGEEDRDTTLDRGRIMSKLIANSRLIIYKKAGHFPFIDQSDKFNRFLIELKQKKL